MNFSVTRAIIFAMIGLPIGFILSALFFAASGQAIEATAILPYGLPIALIIGIAAGFWKTGE